jgi:predicted dehydrogenase
MRRMHRRTFLANSAALAALTVRSTRAARLNEQLNLGFIGLGGRGNELLRQFGKLPDVRFAAICDVDEKALAAAGEKYPKAKRSRDLRRLLEDPDVDAVVIATCNHWHALAAIWACQAGKDVYVEKPLAHNHWEGQQVVSAARRHDRVVQIGTQQRSDPLQDELKHFLHDQKALGEIHFVQVCRVGKRASIGKRSTPLKPPKSVDYNLWLGPALDEPIYRDKLHYDWHWVWNTGNGEMGNWGIHVLDDAINVVLRDQVPFPKRIVSAGGRALWNDAGETPNVGFAYYDTGSVPLLFALSNLDEPARGQALDGASSQSQRGSNFEGIGSGYVVRCEGGYYAGGRGGGSARDPNGKLIRKFSGDSGAGHARNFVDAVFAHDRARLNSEVHIGHQSTSWCNLGNIAVRLGHSYQHNAAATLGQPQQAWGELIDRMEQHLAGISIAASDALRLSPVLEFDSQSEQFVGENADAANKLLRRQYRSGFDVPTIS